MQVEEATNRLIKAVRSSIEYWEGKNEVGWRQAMKEYMYLSMTLSDGEVEEAFKNLIQAIQEEQQSEQPVTEMG